MNLAQLITELEKRGVLTWEVGDEAIIKLPDVEHIRMLVTDIWKFDSGLHLFGRPEPEESIHVKDCTHSADDPRLLGRVLRELEKFEDTTGINIYSGRQILKGTYIKAKIGQRWREFHGDTLLEVALKALLAKVEGEQSWALIGRASRMRKSNALVAAEIFFCGSINMAVSENISQATTRKRQLGKSNIPER